MQESSIISTIDIDDFEYPLPNERIAKFPKENRDESKLLINSNESGIYNAYEIDIESGEKKALTNSTEESYFGQSYFPDDDRFVFSFVGVVC